MSVQFTTLKIKGALIGEENPGIDINNVGYIHAQYALSDECAKKPPLHIGEGMVNSMAPYLQQDTYNRKKKNIKLNVAIVENKYLKAVILLDYGGRLYSLYDKEHHYDLLYVNKYFQPCNLSLRNAWFSGGIEWNVSIKGHNPLTCSRMFAVKTHYQNEEGLKIYEFERKRKIVYSIDFYLPKDSRVLYVLPKINNTENKEKYTYWWSNIAFPQEPMTRVLVPTNYSYITSYHKNAYFLDRKRIPLINSIDTSYPDKARWANDYFYDIPDEEDKWIVAVDKDGKGLFQTSTKELIGRKMFVWGNTVGGNNWQKFLSSDETRYTEIQAGLCQTQLEHLPMKPNSSITWVEAYGFIDLGNKAHIDFDESVKAASQNINEQFDHDIDGELRKIAEHYHHFEVGEIINYGSGWGYIENLIRKQNHLPLISEDVAFPVESVQEESVDFKNLLEDNTFNDYDPMFVPKGYSDNEYIRDCLERLSNNDNWYHEFQLGATECALGNIDSAKKHWLNSIKIKENAWAYRNLATVASNVENNYEESVKLINKAYELNQHFGIIRDKFEIMIKASKYDEAIFFYNSLAKDIQKIGRIKYYKAYCLTKLGRYQEAAQIINQKFLMEDVREGEFSVSDLYYEIYIPLLVKDYKKMKLSDAKRAVDKIAPMDKLDFRMHAEKDYEDE